MSPSNEVMKQWTRIYFTHTSHVHSLRGSSRRAGERSGKLRMQSRCKSGATSVVREHLRRRPWRAAHRALLLRLDALRVLATQTTLTRLLVKVDLLAGRLH